MAEWEIYRLSNTGGTSERQTIAICDKLEYSGSWMGECFLTVTVTSEEPVDFEIGDYIMYRGEKFVLQNVPTVNKKARARSYGEAFVYDNVKFSALHTELTDIQMQDYVLGDNSIHYTAQRDFSFFASDIEDFCDRLQANTNRWCADNGFEFKDYWKFITPNETRTIQRLGKMAKDTGGEWIGLGALSSHDLWEAAYGGGTDTSEEEKNVNVSISNQKVWDCLKIIKEQFGLNFINRDRQVIVGTAGLPTNHIFKYGKGEGLSEIEKVADTEQQVITKMFAYGTEKNMPIRYYANLNMECFASIKRLSFKGCKYDYIDVPFLSTKKCFTRKYSFVYSSTYFDDKVPSQLMEGYLVKFDAGSGYRNWNAEIVSPEKIKEIWLSVTDEDDKESVEEFFSSFTDDKCSVIIPENITLNVGQQITFIEGVNKDKWPSTMRITPLNMPNNMAVGYLMLPGFPKKSLYQWVKEQPDTTRADDETGRATWRGYTAYFSKDQYQPYIKSLNADELGIRESAKVFDGSDGEEIYPTIENTGKDRIYHAEMVTDNGIIETSGVDDVPTVEITLPFTETELRLRDLCTQGTQDGGKPTITMKSGYCGGCEFTFDENDLSAATGRWKVKCERYKNDLLGIYFPYDYSVSMGGSPSEDEPYQLRGTDIFGADGGDKYILTGIAMPEIYVESASVKMLEASLKLLAKNDYTRFTYTPKIDEIFMARQHEQALENDTRSLYLTIKEGDLLKFEDDDLRISDSTIFIDTLVIRENGNNGIPTYEVTLRNDKSVGTIQRMQEQINSLVSGGNNNSSSTSKSSSSSGGGGISSEQAKQQIEAYGERLFLSKLNDDIAAGLIGFVKGFWVKTKGLFGIDSKGNANVNDLSAAGNAIVDGNTHIVGELTVDGITTANDIRSDNYTGSGIADSGFRIYKDADTGNTTAVFDYLTIRKKLTANTIDIKETQFSSGDQAYTLASAEIARTDYLYVDSNGGETLLGYSYKKVPWVLRGIAVVLGKNAAKRIFGRVKNVRIDLNADDLSRCNRIRCYFLAKDGEKEVENWFRVNDLARCQTWNVVNTKRNTFIPDKNDHVGNVYWWRKISDVSWNTGLPRYILKDADGNASKDTTTDASNENIFVNAAGIKRLASNGTFSASVDEKHAPKVIDGETYHWFDVDYDFDVEAAAYAAGQSTNWSDLNSDIPAAGDKVVQFGNTTDPDRMNAFLIEVNGSQNEDAPCWKMFSGIYTFNLDMDWWNGDKGSGTCKSKWSPSTGIWAYAPEFHWIQQNVRARNIFPRPEVYWEDIALEVDDFSVEHTVDLDTYYPDYSDDVRDAQGNLVSRGGFVQVDENTRVYGSAANPLPKNYVRKVHYYEQVSHNGSMWLCSIAESNNHWVANEEFSWTDSHGTTKTYKKGEVVRDYANIPKDDRDGKCSYVLDYTVQEPTPESNDWTEQVQKGDSGAIKSRAFIRTNNDISALRPQGGTYNNPVPTSTIDYEGHVVPGLVWYDGAPNGDEILWSTTAWFYSNGEHSNWSLPTRETDTETIDIEFCPYSKIAGDPYGNDASLRDTETYINTRHEEGWYDPTRDAVLPDDVAAQGITWADMVWRAERRIKNGSYLGTWVISKIKGENAVRVDLSNENDSMLYSSTKGLVSGDVKSVASFFYGSEDVSASTTWKVSSSKTDGTDDCTITSGNSRNIVVTGMAANSAIVTVTGEYTDKNGTKYIKSIQLTLKKLIDVDKYELEIDPHAISYNVSNDDPSTVTVTARIWKTTVDGLRALSAPPTGYKTFVSDSTGSITEKTDSTFSIEISPSEHNDITFKIAKTLDAANFLDCETIPINRTYNGHEAPGQEIVYIRTKNKVAPVIVAEAAGGTAHTLDGYRPTVDGTGRTDIELNGGTSNRPKCTTSPQGVSRQYKYEWKIDRKKGGINETTGRRTWDDYSGTMVLDGVYAESAVRLDIDNEADMIQTDSNGVISANRTVLALVRFYDGATEIDLSEASLVIDGAPTASVATSYNEKVTGQKYRKLRWVFKAGKTMNDVYNITVSYTYPETGLTYSAELSVSASKGMPIFQLKPSHSALPCTRTQDNTLNNPPALSLKIVKVDGSSSSETEATQSDLSTLGVIVRYSFSAVPANKDAGDVWPPENSLQAATTNENVFIAMFNGNGVLLDRETVPLVKDGLNGGSNIRIDLDNEYDSVLTDADGNVIKERVISVIAAIYEGGKAVESELATSLDDLKICGHDGYTGPNNKITTKHNFIWIIKPAYNGNAADVINDIITKEITLRYNGEDYSHKFVVAPSLGNSIFELSPSPSVFKRERVEGNNLGYDDVVIGMNVLESKGFDWTTYGTYNEWKNLVTIRYSTTAMPASASAGTELASNSLTITDDVDNVYFAMFDLDGDLLDRETVPVMKDGNDIHPNLLNGSSFDHNLSAWRFASGREFVEGQKYGQKAVRSRRAIEIDFAEQVIAGDRFNTERNILKPSTWYTLSYWVRGNGRMASYIYTSPQGHSIDTTKKVRINGVEQNVTAQDGAITTTLSSDWQKITFTFFTVSSFTTKVYLLFRGFGADVYLCCPKIEEGAIATGWCLSEKDKMGADGNGYERVYLLAKNGYTPTINQGTDSQRNQDEYLPDVGNYSSFGNVNPFYTSYWEDEPSFNPTYEWPVLWWAERKYDGDSKTWGLFGTPKEFNRFQSVEAIRLNRDNYYTEERWEALGSIGYNQSIDRITAEPYSEEAFDDCRVGDTFVISGKSRDMAINHIVTFMCTSSGVDRLNGQCLSHIKDGGRADFKSRVFTRTNLDIESEDYIPVGGTYDSPWPGNASGANGQPGGVKWYDSIPAGNAKIWSSIRTFKGDSTETSWSIPRCESDTADIDIEFSPRTEMPDVTTLRDTVGDEHPVANVWYDSSELPEDETMIWRAERKIKNGDWDGDWVITRIRGEKGDAVTMTEHWVKYVAQNSTDFTGTHPSISSSDVAWNPGIPSIPNGGYLWTWIHEKYSNNVVNDAFSVSRVGVDGNGVVSSTVDYCQKQNTNVAPENFASTDWGSYPTSLNQGWWLYTRTIIVYSDGATAVSYSSHQIGTGSHYAGVEEYYAISNSDSTAPVGYPTQGTYGEGQTIDVGKDWQKGTRPKNDPAKPYLWNFEISSDSSGTRYVTSPICIGNWSRGIVAILELYAISESNFVFDNEEYPDDIEGWTDEHYNAAPTDAKPYQWNKTIVAYNDSVRDNNSASGWDESTCDVFYHISAEKAFDGKNAIHVDLDNEHEDFLYNDNNQLVAPKITGGFKVRARLFDGDADKTSQTQWSIDLNNSYGANAQIGSQTGILTITGLISDSACIKVCGLYNNIPYYKDFTAKRIKDDKYDIVLKPDAITYNSDNTWSNKTINISSVRTDIQGNRSDVTIETRTPYVGSICVFYGFVGANGAIGTMTQVGTTFNVTENIVQNNDGIYFELRRYTSASEYTVVDYETVTIAKTANGIAARGYLPAEMFVRMTTESTPTKPADDKGSYNTPNPENCLAGQDSKGTNRYWSDGVPAGDEQLWSTRRLFSSDGAYQDEEWSEPRKMTDTSTYDVEFAKEQANDAAPATPTTANRHGGSGTQIWFDPTLDTSEDFTKMVWRAERRCENGVWGSWTILRIKGEKGDEAAKQTGKEEWFLALGGNTRPSVPTINVVSNVPRSTISGQSVAWSLGQDATWSKTKKYLYEVDKYTLSDGTTYWGNPFFFGEFAEGEQGIPGDDSYSVEVDPPHIIFNQKKTSSGVAFEYDSQNPAVLTPKVTKGNNTTNLVTAVAIKSGGNYCVKNANVNIVDCSISQDGKKVRVTGVNSTAADAANRYTQGYLVLVITADGKTFEATVPIAVNYTANYVDETIDSVHSEWVEEVVTTIVDGEFFVTTSEYSETKTAVQALETWKSTAESTLDGHTTSIGNLNTSLNTAQQSLSELQTTVDGVVQSQSEIRQTSKEIELSVMSQDNIALVTGKNTITSNSQWSGALALADVTYGNDKPKEVIINMDYQWTDNPGQMLVYGWINTPTTSGRSFEVLLIFNTNGTVTMSIYSGASYVNGYEVITNSTQSDLIKKGNIIIKVGNSGNDITSFAATTGIENNSITLSNILITDGLSIRQGLRRTGIDISAGEIDVQADKFTVHNTDGSMMMGLNSDGNVEFAGVVKAKELFHRICFHGGMDYGASEPNKNYWPTGIFNGYGETPNTGLADVVYHTEERAADSQYNGNTSIYLPDPATCEGKVVEIYSRNFSSNGAKTFYVGIAGENANARRFVREAWPRVQNGNIVVRGGTEDLFTFQCDFGCGYKFIAVKDMSYNGNTRSVWIGIQIVGESWVLGI